MIARGIPTRRIEAGDDLFFVFCESLGGILEEDSIIVITSKILSVAENSVQNFYSEEEFFQIVESEADAVLARKGKFWLTEKQGLLLPNAGIDRSNAPPHTAILLPRDSAKFSRDFRHQLCAHFGISRCGVLVVDSRVVSRRLGISGIALGWSGFCGVSDERGKKDLFGKELSVSFLAVADNIASFAQIFFGQSGEQTPFVLLEKCEKIHFTDLAQDPQIAIVSEHDDLFHF